MQLSLQLSKLQGTTSYFDENVGRVGVKSDTVKVVVGLSKIYPNIHTILFIKWGIVKQCIYQFLSACLRLQTQTMNALSYKRLSHCTVMRFQQF